MRQAFLRRILEVSLLVLSLAVAAIAAEGLSRLVVDPVDYLMADPVFDSVLGLRLEPHVAGHDEWGFRNREVPKQAAVVTIGDSQTYGVGAPAPLSWPAQLAKLIDRPVYNASLGGYSPIQYRELLNRYAMRLRPSTVIVGFYYGNDLWEAHQAVYGLRHWTALRKPGIPTRARFDEDDAPKTKFLGPLRDWLARHSVIYRMATSSILGTQARQAEFVARTRGGDVVEFRDPVTGITTGLTPAYRLRALNLDSANVKEGLALSLERFERMAQDCRAARIDLLIALIPTKERVYQPWIEADPKLRDNESLGALLRNENEADRRIKEYLSQHHVRYLDLVVPLRQAARHVAIYPPNEDGHPNAEGYSAIAKAVASAIAP
jgi:lysophospholipase L1-like esterase